MHNNLLCTHIFILYRDMVTMNLNDNDNGQTLGKFNSAEEFL